VSGPGSITDLSRDRVPEAVTTEVCVVGSGAAGATAARVLAEAGREVLVLEEGGDFSGKQLTQRETAMYDQLYMDRGGRATEDLSISVLQGRVLGGGPLINMCDVVPMSEAVMEHWRRRFGLKGFSPGALRPHARAALSDLSASPIDESQVNLANRLLRRGTRALGLRGRLMLHNRVGCQELGTCLIGCPVGAKRTPRSVAIPAAVTAGARFWVRARAVRIEGAAAETKEIAVRALDARGYHERQTVVVRARTVILAANAVATPQLLLRSGIGNEHVGRHLMLQPQLPLVARFTERVEPFVGIPQAWAVTEYEQHDHRQHGLWGFRIEGIMGTPGIAATLLPFVGLEGKRRMTQLPHYAAALLLVPDQPSGAVELTGGGRPLVRYRQRDDLRARLRRAARAAARIYLAAGAQEVIIPTAPPLLITRESQLGQIDGISFRPASAPLLSAHQQGTVRLSVDPARGAATPDGQVYGTRGVYVFDTSINPSSASSHTMAPAITLARYLSARLLGLGAGGG
jgi:choline dehydrogenase-like flavoprotein